MARSRATSCGTVPQLGERAARAAGHRRRKTVREELGARALLEHLAQRLATGDEAAGRAPQRLAERSGEHDVVTSQQAEALHHAATGLADHPDPVRVVDDQRRLVLGGDRGQLGDRREVTLHAEYPVGDDQAALDGRRLTQRAAQVVRVGVLVDGLVRRARETHPVNDRRVVQAIGEDRRRPVAERVEQRGVRVPAGDVGQRRRCPAELGQVVLELYVGRELSADEAHRCGPGSVAGEPVGSRGDDVGVVRQAEVVVRAKADDLAASLDLDQRALRRVQDRNPLARARLAHRRQLGAELGLERHGDEAPSAASIESWTIA